jgi:hypothetical protein
MRSSPPEGNSDRNGFESPAVGPERAAALETTKDRKRHNKSVILIHTSGATEVDTAEGGEKFPGGALGTA